MIFETERLIIKEIETEKEIEGLFKIYNNNNNMKFLNNSNYEWTINNLKLKLLLYKKYYKIGYGIYIAKLKIDSTIIAEVSIFNSFDDLKKPEIGYLIDEYYWNSKYGTEIVSGLLKYLQTKNITGIYSRMMPENIASSKICLNLGFKDIGIENLESGIKRQTLFIEF